jgi:hypothetical protein
MTFKLFEVMTSAFSLGTIGSVASSFPPPRTPDKKQSLSDSILDVLIVWYFECSDSVVFWIF